MVHVEFLELLELLKTVHSHQLVAVGLENFQLAEHAKLKSVEVLETVVR